MGQVQAYRTERLFSGSKEMIAIEYDFAKDAGAVGSLDLMIAKDAMVIHSAHVKVKAACTSGGSATVSIGKSGDVAGIVAATAVASLTTGAAIDSASFGSAYKLAADDVVQIAIATAALTAGKVIVILEVSKF